MKSRDFQLEQATNQDQIDFAIITALDKEAKAVVRHLENHTIQRFEEQDIRTYHMGTIPIAGADQAYQVAVVLLPNMGETSAATAVTDTIIHWKPNFLLMVGIAGGIPQDDLDLGDVVIADQVVGYEYGKLTDKGLKPRDRVYPAGALLLDRIRNFWDDSWADQVGARRPTNAKRSRSKSFVGPITSGNKVIASAKFRDQLLTHWPKLHAVEMEAEGVFAAAFERPHITQTLVIRGISDMADERKGDEWQEYAANAAAAFTVSFLRSGPVEARGNISVHSPTNVSPLSPNVIRPSMPAKTISAELYIRIRQTLLDCGPFTSNHQLSAVFAHPDLRPWQTGLPQANSVQERVELLMNYLSKQRHTDGRNALAIFLQVLSERMEPATECHHRLATIAREL